MTGAIRLLSAAAAAAAVALTACNNRNEESSASPSPVRDEPGIEVALERTACFGSCPIYRLGIAPDGLVTFEGIDFVRHMGTDTARVPAADLQRLVEAADRAAFFDRPPSYREGDETCREWFPDSPSVIIGIRDGLRHHVITVDHGCTGIPQELPELAQLIDEVAMSARWTGH